MYVEDECSDVLLLRLAFKREGLAKNLKVVSDGQQAIDYLSGKPPYQERAEHPLPALVLLDLHLPQVDGFEVLQWIRRQPELKTMRVVIFSSSDLASDRERAMRLGANEYLLKPLGGAFGEVAQYLKNWLTPPTRARIPQRPPPAPVTTTPP